MTDHTDLISRLRSMLHNETVKHRFYAIADASDALEAQEKRIAELTAALEPFAEVAERYAYCLPDSGMPAVAEDDVVMFELMYFHQARKVLGEKE